jgi:hypothetical protein
MKSDAWKVTSGDQAEAHTLIRYDYFVLMMRLLRGARLTSLTKHYKVKKGGKNVNVLKR